jgi:hypothetical protein
MIVWKNENGKLVAAGPGWKAYRSSANIGIGYLFKIKNAYAR